MRHGANRTRHEPGAIGWKHGAIGESRPAGRGYAAWQEMAAARSNAFPLEANWPVLLRDLGVKPRSVLRRAELPEDLFSRRDVSLPTPEYFRLWSAVEAETGDPAFPIRAAEVVRSEAFHPAIFAALCSSDFTIAAHRLADYKRLVAPMELVVDEGVDTLRVDLRWLDRAVVPPISLAAFELAFLVQLVRVATRERVRPLRVETPRPPRPAAEYTKFFGTRVQPSDAHALTFARADAHRPFLTANERMWRMFEPALRRRLADLDAEASFRSRVRAALLEALPSGESSMEHVARRLAMSKRTLQRRLRDEATTFQAELASTREDLARHYLANTRLSGAEISYLLGFEDPNSFFRAFHAWTGLTTEQLRL